MSKRKRYPWVWITRDRGCDFVEIWAPEAKPVFDGLYWNHPAEASLDIQCVEAFAAVMHWAPPPGTRWKVWFGFEAEEE